MLAEGVAVAVPSYDLCPQVPLASIVEQMRAAARLLHRRSGRRLLATGHSAGGHLTAMLMATDWRALDPRLPAGLVAAGLPISGVFELEPLLPTTIGAGLRLSPAEARALSPRQLPSPAPAAACRGGRGGKRRVPSPDPRLRRRLGRHGGGGAGCEPLHHPRAAGRAGQRPARRAAAMALGVG